MVGLIVPFSLHSSVEPSWNCLNRISSNFNIEIHPFYSIWSNSIFFSWIQGFISYHIISFLAYTKCTNIYTTHVSRSFKKSPPLSPLCVSKMSPCHLVTSHSPPLAVEYRSPGLAKATTTTKDHERIPESQKYQGFKVKTSKPFFAFSFWTWTLESGFGLDDGRFFLLEKK